MIADFLYELKEKISQEKKLVKELESFFNAIKGAKNADEVAKMTRQIQQLKESLKKTNNEIPRILKNLAVKAPLNQTRQDTANSKELINKINKTEIKKTSSKGQVFRNKKARAIVDSLEGETIRRLKKKKKVAIKKKAKKANSYIIISNKIFSGLSLKLTKYSLFRPLKRDLIKANLEFPQISYISVILLTTLLSFLFGIFLFFFFLLFNLEPLIPFITKSSEDMLTRLPKVFLIPIVLPILTFIALYSYPSMERKSAKNKINAELPFATIHMSAISGSMVDPSKIFEILILTKEYPTVAKEFTKLINEIHIYGYDLVSALKNTAENSPSKKLADLLNGLATTITSGGDLPEFFDKRASTLLFDYRIEREKEIRASETFMDIYISLVIAAPMILMLILMMMKISGLGIQLSTGMITLIMVLGVSTINILFLIFLNLKQSAGGGG